MSYWFDDSSPRSPRSSTPTRPINQEVEARVAAQRKADIDEAAKREALHAKYRPLVNALKLANPDAQWGYQTHNGDLPRGCDTINAALQRWHVHSDPVGIVAWGKELLVWRHGPHVCPFGAAVVEELMTINMSGM